MASHDDRSESMNADQTRENPGEYPVMSSVDGNWQFQLLSQAFLITSQQDPGQRVELSVSAAYDMLDYLYKLRDELAQLTGQARKEDS
ncbi:MAG TPA: hypothetical protein VF026_15695 [Ktedonobacteraceae bacterium]